MVVKVYISGISGNKEVKKRQQRVLMILDSKNIKYEIIDITEPGREDDKDFMQNNAKCNGGTVSDPNPRSPLPPQLFNDLEYCGDYDQFDLANEVDTLEQFLKLELPPEEPPQTEKENAVNGDVSGGKVGKESKENSQERETVVSNETGEKEPSPTKETAAKAESPVREATPTKEEAVEDNTEQNEENNEAKAESPAKETTPEKEKSPQRQKSIDKEPSPVRENEEKAQNSHESEETVNGAVRSREQSEDIEVDEEQTGKSERKVDDPSIALIQSEAAAAAE